MSGVRKLSRQDCFFLLYLLILVSAYAVHFLSFTLFEGFTTFSNDAGSYVLAAQKWSPFFPPSDVVLYTWPAQILPPGFPWALAITGASKSLWSGHLLVSLCMLASIVLVGWMSYRRMGWLIGGLLTLGFCLLPGVVTSSMGILSENLYLLLSLTVLLLYSIIKKHEDTSPVWYLLLLFFLSFAILTRTIGIALIAAIFLVTMFDNELSGKRKFSFHIIVFSSVALWLLWSAINPQTSDLTYGAYLKNLVGSNVTMYGVLAVLWHNFNINLMQILSSWSHYFSLSHSNVWFFLFSYSLFVPCLIGLGLRLFQGKLDAVYLLFYVAILLIWPYPTQMTRFLHPIVFLLILQPLLYVTGKPKFQHHILTKTTLVIVILALIVNSFIVQVRLLEQREAAMSINPELANSYELYDSPSWDAGAIRASIFADVMRYMAMSAKYVPASSVVATVKPVNYSILANRRAINHVAVVPRLQQLCNLNIKDADFVFLSALTTKFNQEGRAQLKKLKGISSNVWMMKGEDGKAGAFVLAIDKMRLESELVSESYICQYFQDHP